MRTICVYEAKQSLLALVASAEAGEKVRIARHGKVVVRMLPLKPTLAPAATPEQIERELRAIRELHRRVKPGPGWKALRDAGRRF